MEITRFLTIAFILVLFAGIGIAATEISDWNDLDEIRDDLSGEYELINDLDEDTDGYDDLVDAEDGWDPIDNFEGTFDGDFPARNFDCS